MLKWDQPRWWWTVAWVQLGAGAVPLLMALNWYQHSVPAYCTLIGCALFQYVILRHFWSRFVFGERVVEAMAVQTRRLRALDQLFAESE